MSIRSLERQQLIIDEKRNSQTLKSIDSDIANAQNGPIEDGTRVTMASAGTCTVAKSTKENMAQHNSFGLPTQNALRLASRKMGLGVHKFWYATGPSFPKPYCDIVYAQIDAGFFGTSQSHELTIDMISVYLYQIMKLVLFHSPRCID